MGSVHTEFVGSSRFYVSDDNPGINVPGVTSVLNVIPKGFLAPWQAKMAAELAVDLIAELPAMAKRDPKGTVDFVKSAAPRYSKHRAKIGSAAHDQFERIIRGEGLAPMPDDLSDEDVAEVMSMVDNFRDFLSVVKPELIDAENTAWSDTHGYAGSFDAFLRIKLNPETLELDTENGTPVDVVGDWKTGKSTYADVALQLAAYKNADRIISPEGVSRPMPPTQGAVVLHVTADKWTFKRVKVSDDVFAVFLKCLDFFTAMREWEGEGWGRNRIRGLSDDVIGKPIAKSSRRMVTGTERRGK